MKLLKVYFDAFKSLINEELVINNDCLGIVGTNESGKTNILSAIKVMEGGYSLGEAHRPKIDRDLNPRLKFDFGLTEVEKGEFFDKINEWIKYNGLVDFDASDLSFDIQYIVEYDVDSEEERRSFKVIYKDGFPEDAYILKNEFIADKHKIMFNNQLKSFNSAMIISRNIIEKSMGYQEEVLERIEKLNVEIQDKEKLFEELNEEYLEDPLDAKKSEKRENELNLLQELREILKNKEDEYESLTFESKKIALKDVINKLELDIKNANREKENSITIINELQLKDDLTAHQKGLITKNKKIRDEEEKKLEKLRSDFEKESKKLEKWSLSLNEKYTRDFDSLSNYVGKLTNDLLKSYLPKIVFWQHSPDYVLRSETDLKDIMLITSLNDISRPLLNIFRVGLGVHSLDDLKSKIKIIQNDSSERGRLQDSFNRELNKYVKDVWKDYDQELKVFLEEFKIRIQFYDPKTDGASYFDMNERSQGAQTFISFLMTIGAEAKTMVMKDMILLLDEPELHLHPSGVRFMLQELIGISKLNQVIYATHSIFMIDRENYDRHVFLKKEHEKTSINPSRKDRIGFFMQEEVLHKAIDIDLTKDFYSSNQFNFVFEGLGDVLAFEKFYGLLDNQPFEIKKTSFYQGGKCNDIIKYFTRNPIQLSTKWVFIIDNDKPANKLRSFIESKYKDYLMKDIFIFQYMLNEQSRNIELEDLMSAELMSRVYVKALELTGFKEVDVSVIRELVESERVYQEYNKEILKKFDLLGGDLDIFKTNFKEIFNNEILLSTSESKNLEEFKEKFEEFNKWAVGVVESIDKSKLVKVDKKNFENSGVV